MTPLQEEDEAATLARGFRDSKEVCRAGSSYRLGCRWGRCGRSGESYQGTNIGEDRALLFIGKPFIPPCHSCSRTAITDDPEKLLVRFGGGLRRHQISGAG